MNEINNKYLIRHILNQRVDLLGQPKIKEKIDALNILKLKGEISDIEYVYPLVFDRSNELASAAAQTVREIMKKVQGKQWNNVYENVKYIKVNIDAIDTVLNFDSSNSAHLLGVASLNCNGYVREKALSLISGVLNTSAVPYILLRLNDWVPSVRNIAGQILKNTFTEDYIEAYIDNCYLVNKLQNITRVDLKSIRQEILRYLKNDKLKDKLKSRLRHPNIKTRLFCYMILQNLIYTDEDIIKSAMKDKSFEIKIWLVDAIKNLEARKQNAVIGELLHDKSAKVKIAMLRSFEEPIVNSFKDILLGYVADEHASVRDEARFIAKKHSIIKDFSQFYRNQIINDLSQGALAGLGETGVRSDLDIVSNFCMHEESKIRLAAMSAMWYLSDEDALSLVLDSLDSNVPRIRKTAKRFLKSSKLPAVLIEMKKKLQCGNDEIKVFALEVINGFERWQALESILIAIVNENGIVLSKSKELLERWLLGSYALYSKPDRLLRERLVALLEIVGRKRIVSDNILKELSFILETRG